MEASEERLEALDLNQQAVMLLKSGNIADAKERLERAIELDPMLMENYKNYGDVYMAEQDYKEAKNLYKKALLIDKRGELYFLYGNACFMADDVHEGLENYNLALSNGYDSEEMLFFMGMAYEHLNDESMALRYFQKACIKNPSRPDFIVKKIMTLLNLGMEEEAEESIRELIKTAPELYDGYHLRTQMLIRRKDYTAAAASAKEASDKFPEDADLMYDYAQSVALSGDYKKAYQLVEQAKSMKYFEDAKRNFTLLEAQIAAEDQDVDRAIRCCGMCIDMEKEGVFDGEARFMMMNLQLTKPDFEAALAQAQALIDSQKEDSYYYAALYYRPFCMKQLGRMDEVQKYLKEANSYYRVCTLKHPEAADAYLYRAMCLKDMEEYDKALEMIEFVDKITNGIAEVHTLRAEIYRALGKEAQAEEEMQKAYQEKPELRNVFEKEEN